MGLVRASLRWSACVLYALAGVSPSFAMPLAGIPLPIPAQLQVVGGSTVNLPPDRLLVSKVPGSVKDSEAVTVQVGPDGTPAVVEVLQRLTLEGTGDYVVRERGPARAVAAVGDGPIPVLQRGTVVWQGFSPGHRDLAATLRLDPVLELARLPLGVELGFVPDASAGSASSALAEPLGAGGVVTRAGTVTLRLRNQTTQSIDIASGQASRTALAAVMTRLQEAAAHPGLRPPIAGAGLPRALEGTATSNPTATSTFVPIHIDGVLSVSGAAATFIGRGLTAHSSSANLAGILSATAAFSVHVSGPARFSMTVHGLPGLDARALGPPGDHRSWTAWASSPDSLTEQTAVTTQALGAVAQAAIGAQLVPYLAANLDGELSSSFTYELAPTLAVAAVARSLTPRPLPIALAAVLLIAALVGLDRLRRRL